MYTQPSAVSTFTSIPPGTGLSYSAGTGLGDVVEVVAEATRAKKVVEKIAETAVVPSGKPGSKAPVLFGSEDRSRGISAAEKAADPNATTPPRGSLDLSR